MIEYIPACTEDANQEDCTLDCEYDNSYEWCAALTRCQMEDDCCQAACEGDEDCEDDCTAYATACRATNGTWSGASNMACKANRCAELNRYYMAQGVAHCASHTDEDAHALCLAPYQSAYYECYGPVTCETRYNELCPEMCFHIHDTYDETCTANCGTSLNYCECMELQNACKAECEGADDVDGCSGDCESDNDCSAL